MCVIGYDFVRYLSDGIWVCWGIEVVGLVDLMVYSDGLVLLLFYFDCYCGFVGEC